MEVIQHKILVQQMDASHNNKFDKIICFITLALYTAILKMKF